MYKNLQILCVHVDCIFLQLRLSYALSAQYKTYTDLQMVKSLIILIPQV